MRRRATIAIVAAAGAAATAGAVAGAGDRSRPSQTSENSTAALATVERQDLVERETVDGTLGYADQGTLKAGRSGTLTKLPKAGRVIKRGQALYEVDGEPGAWSMYGRRPAWRTFQPGMSDGDDVRQLERNLEALGYDPGEVDGEWTSETTDAVTDFQEDRGMTEDGILELGEIVFRRGATRMGEAKAEVGDRVGSGAPLAGVSGTRREVLVELDATQQDLVRVGDRVTVELPNGRTLRGRVREIGAVARQGEGEDGGAVVDVRISVRGRAGRLDQAPVDVGLVRERSRDVLTVPVSALLARPGGGYAVETADGRLIDVEPGLYADDRVEVSGAGLRPGLKVKVPS